MLNNVFVRNLLMLHSSLQQKFVNYGEKSFIKMAPGVDAKKRFRP
jgi:hypothetical protein